MNISETIKTLTKDQLTEILYEIQQYQRFSRISHKKGKEWYDIHTSGTKRSQIQHFGSLSASFRRVLVAYYHESFDCHNAEIDFIQDDTLQGGIRMFLGDEMIECSVQDFERKILRT